MKKSELATHANGATSIKSDPVLISPPVRKSIEEKGILKATWQLDPKKKGGNMK